MTDEQRQIRELRKWLKHLTRSVSAFIDLMDAEIPKIPQARSYERGKRMAGWVNSLEVHNDEARHFGLGEKLRKASHTTQVH